MPPVIQLKLYRDALFIFILLPARSPVGAQVKNLRSEP